MAVVGLEARYQAALDLPFQNRVGEAVREAALQIYAELNTTPGHAARATYATSILNDGSRQHALLFSAACVAQGVDTTSTDAQIATAVAGAWNALAGA